MTDGRVTIAETRGLNDVVGMMLTRILKFAKPGRASLVDTITSAGLHRPKKLMADRCAQEI